MKSANITVVDPVVPISILSLSEFTAQEFTFFDDFFHGERYYRELAGKLL